MTLTQLQTLSQTEEGRQKLRVMLAELRGWRMFQFSGAPQSAYEHPSEHPFDGYDGPRQATPNGIIVPDSARGETIEDVLSRWGMPNYPSDLNACAEVERTLNPDQGIIFRHLLAQNSDGPQRTFPTVEAAMCHAAATQRTIALILCLQLESSK